MATRNRLTDSGQKVQKGTAAQLGVKASKRRAAGELSTKDMQWEQKVAKGPSASARVNRNVAAANTTGRKAVTKSKLANDFAASDFPDIVKKNLGAGIAKRPGAMMPKSTGPAKKSTRSRKTSK